MASNFEEFQVTIGPITCHAWNADRTCVALSPNNEEVHIYKKDKGTFNLEFVLKEHDKTVTSIDWSAKTNRIVSCSQDRNAYVWNWDAASNNWKPTLVLLRINRAATFVRWSPSEEMFAVASGARCVSICYFEQENNWWVSKHVKKPLRSTVLSLDWHPTEPIIATGSCDFKARVFSVAIKGYCTKPKDSVWGEDFSFNSVLGEFGGGGWVHSVAFSPSGNALAWVTHDCTLNVYYPKSKFTSVVRTSFLPFTRVVFTSENSIIASGYDCVPVLFQGSEGAEWTLVDKLDTGMKKESSQGSTNSAFNKFKMMDSRNQQSSTDLNLASVHQNTISDLRVYNANSNSKAVEKLSTCGLDGRIVVWNNASLQASLEKLKISNSR